MNKVVIQREKCKGCGLCISVCPKKILQFENGFNSKGHHPSSCTDMQQCIGCTQCAQICPDIAIEIFAERG